MRRHKRVVAMALALAARPRPDPFRSIELAAVGSVRANGRAPGLYPLGPPGVGLLVFDPARGEPLVPSGRLVPGGLLVECHPADDAG